MSKKNWDKIIKQEVAHIHDVAPDHEEAFADLRDLVNSRH